VVVVDVVEDRDIGVVVVDVAEDRDVDVVEYRGVNMVVIEPETIVG
jgi:hypothetical protein